MKISELEIIDPVGENGYSRLAYKMTAFLNQKIKERAESGWELSNILERKDGWFLLHFVKDIGEKSVSPTQPRTKTRKIRPIVSLTPRRRKSEVCK